MAEEQSYFKGLPFSPLVTVMHSLFADDLLVFGMLNRNQWFYLHYILIRFRHASGLCINNEKSLLIYNEGDMEEIKFIAAFMGTNSRHISKGLTYLGFRLKACSYTTADWIWLVEKFSNKINKWQNITFDGR